MLSSFSGLIGWVPNHDTLHILLDEYRSLPNVNLSLQIEEKLMESWAGGYAQLAKLTLIQKIEAFQYSLSRTNGKDLAQTMWIKSPNSEVPTLHSKAHTPPLADTLSTLFLSHQVWLDRRTNYTRSLAVMSMVGYMLGLGDRHFSNIMLDRYSGKITHIDFGDCFEVSYAKMCFLSYPIERLLCKGNRILRRFLSGLQGCSSTRWK